MNTSFLKGNMEGVLTRSEMKSITAGGIVCEVMPGNCSCEAFGENGHGDWDQYEQCLDDRYGPELN